MSLPESLYFSHTEHKIIIIDCYAEWCGPCVALYPSYQVLWKDHERADERITLKKVCIDKFSEKINSLLPGDAKLDAKDNGCFPLMLILRFKSLAAYISGVDAPAMNNHVNTNIPAVDEIKVPSK